MAKPVGPFRLLEANIGIKMGESQVPYPYEPAQMQAIRASISEPRFATYMARAGNQEKYAATLYLYNARLAKAFLYPLNVVEVTLRNAIDEMLVQKFGVDWHQAPAFRDNTLTVNGLATLEKAIERAGIGAPKSQVVATLTFDFWSNLFRPDYGGLWRTNLNIIFPNIPRGTGRHDIQKLVREINKFRNRVAHHEPILDLNVTDIYSKAVQLTELRCIETALWMKHHTVLHAVIRTRPRAADAVGLTLSSRFSSKFVAVNVDTTLMEIIERVDEKHPAIVCIDSAGAPLAAFTMLDVTRYISLCSKELDGLIDLNDHTVNQVLERCDLSGRWVPMDENTPFALAITELQKPRIQLVVGVNTECSKATGAILRAHRRY